MVSSSLAPKWPISVPFCGMDHQKSHFSLISDTLSVRGCWGQPMSFFWKLVDETQMSNPREPTMRHYQIKLLILLPPETFTLDHSQMRHPVLRFDQIDPNLHLHSCYRKCTMDYRHLWFSNNPCNISFSFWPSNPHCLPRIWTFGFDIFWPFYLWSIWWWLPIRPELHELQPRNNN